MKITVKEMLAYLDDENRHNFLCTCSECEKELEKYFNYLAMKSDLEEILKAQNV